MARAINSGPPSPYLSHFQPFIAIFSHVPPGPLGVAGGGWGWIPGCSGGEIEPVLRDSIFFFALLRKDMSECRTKVQQPTRQSFRSGCASLPVGRVGLTALPATFCCRQFFLFGLFGAPAAPTTARLSGIIFGPPWPISIISIFSWHFCPLNNLNSQHHLPTVQYHPPLNSSNTLLRYVFAIYGSSTPRFGFSRRSSPEMRCSLRHRLKQCPSSSSPLMFVPTRHLFRIPAIESLVAQSWSEPQSSTIA